MPVDRCRIDHCRPIGPVGKNLIPSALKVADTLAQDVCGNSAADEVLRHVPVGIDDRLTYVAGQERRLLIDLPDNVSAAAIGLAVSATGLASTKTTVLLTPEEIDQAVKTKVNYKAPGS